MCHAVGVPAYDAVLFDWSGTLVHDPPPRDRLVRALQLLDRDLDREAVDALLAGLDTAGLLPEVEAAMIGEDTSAERHRAANLLHFERAGLDPDLAEMLYRFDHEACHRPLYPDAPATLTALRAHDVKIAVVSDIHLDIRVLLDGQGVGTMVDAYVLSFEHGCQKPDPAMFRIALELLEVDAERALMVGDRCSHDGGSVAAGVAAFILPPPPPVLTARGLETVARIVGCEP